jgi:dolichol-phosphate mannosyltransferase
MDTEMIHIILAAYNEEKDLPGLLAEIEGNNWEIPYRVVVVDDGSTDATPAILRAAAGRLPLNVVTHERNAGLGRALATGFAAVCRDMKRNDVIVTMDADRTHPVALIAAMAAKIAAGNDLVIASRFAPGGEQIGLALHRRFLSYCAGRIFGLFLPLPGVTDYTCGFRAYSDKVVNAMARAYGDRLIEEKGFAATAELLCKAGRFAVAIAEVPLALHYEYKAGESKMKIMNTICGYLRLMYKIQRAVKVSSTTGVL